MLQGDDRWSFFSLSILPAFFPHILPLATSLTQIIIDWLLQYNEGTIFSTRHCCSQHAFSSIFRNQFLIDLQMDTLGERQKVKWKWSSASYLAVCPESISESVIWEMEPLGMIKQMRTHGWWDSFPPCIYVYGGNFPGFSMSKGLNIKGGRWILDQACEDYKTGHSLEDMSLLARQVPSKSSYKTCDATLTEAETTSDLPVAF